MSYSMTSIDFNSWVSYYLVYRLLPKNIVTMSNNQFLIKNYKIYQYYIWEMGNITIIQIIIIFVFISSTNQKVSNTNQKVSNTKTLNPLIIQLSLILLVYL